VTVSTCAAGSFDTSVLVYRRDAEDCTASTWLACSGDTEFDAGCQDYHSEAVFVATAGAEYLIRVGGYSAGEGGPGVLRLSIDEHDNPCDCPADIDVDLVVDVGDLLTVLGQWGVAGGPADVDGDGIVGVGDMLLVLSAWGPCPAELVLRNPFELPVPAEVAADGAFAIWWAPQFDHADDAVIMLDRLNGIRDECVHDLGMRDPPNPEACFHFNVYVHHGPADDFPNGWGAGVGTDRHHFPYMTLPDGAHLSDSYLYHEGFHVFQYQGSSPGFGLSDAGWYVESSAQWYMASNMPGDDNAFVEAGAIIANPQLALWHSFGNEAPGDPVDWLYQVRQYGMHTLLYYLTDVVGVDSEIITGGFYSGTDLRPQEHLYTLIGPDTLRDHFADWAARNTGGLDYLTPAQVQEAQEEVELVGDPDNLHPYIAEVTDVQIGDAWTFEPCAGGVIGSCFAPRGWAYNVIRIENSEAATYAFTLEGAATGSQGAASHFEGRIVVMQDAGPVYVDLEMTNDLDGAGSVEVAATDAEVLLVVVSVPGHFTGNQTYGYRVEVERMPVPPDGGNGS
jgi:hypothetical protein